MEWERLKLLSSLHFSENHRFISVFPKLLQANCTNPFIQGKFFLFFPSHNAINAPISGRRKHPDAFGWSRVQFGFAMEKVSHFCFPTIVPMPLYPALLALKAQKRTSLAVLVDPDMANLEQLNRLIDLAVASGVGFFFVGGSLLVSGRLEATVLAIKKRCTIPVVLFPGATTHLTPAADALLYLSLISGRNPELLIGQHVLSATAVKRSGLEVMPTGYMLVDGGATTTVSYISNTTPLPANKPGIAVSTALAGELLGMKLIFMDAGSGAPRPVPEAMISAVATTIEVPLVVGGGICTPLQVYEAAKAGASLVVVGNILEQNPELLPEMAAAIAQGKRAAVTANPLACV